MRYPYTLTLTQEERRALDKVGHRYEHGDGLFRLLWLECENNQGEEADWCEDYDLKFLIPEHVAWSIREIGEECGFRWDLLAPELREKLSLFCYGVV